MYSSEKEGRVIPCGFRFSPTNIELVQFYLKNKILGWKFPFDLIPIVDVFASSPDNLPLNEFNCGQPNGYWYFYSNRRKGKILTDDGYYELSSHRTIIDGKKLIGFVRTLDFYNGRPPRGTKSQWTIHEYRVNADTIKVNEDDIILKEKISNFVVCKLVKKGIYEPESSEEENIFSGKNSLSDKNQHNQSGRESEGSNFSMKDNKQNSKGNNSLSDEDKYSQSNTILSQEKVEKLKYSRDDKENSEDDQEKNDIIISQANDAAPKS